MRGGETGNAMAIKTNFIKDIIQALLSTELYLRK
jgi:hypothetical protein